MLSINKIEMNHFYSEESRQALIMQSKYYLVLKYNLDESKANEVAKQHVMLVHKMLNKLINKGDYKNINKLLDCCNNHSVRGSFLFSNMIYTFDNKKIVEKFDNYLINKLENKNQADGLLNILITNQINNRVKNDCDNIHKALINFDENNLPLSKAIIKHAINKDKLIKENSFDDIDSVNKKMINNFRNLNEDKKVSNVISELLTYTVKGLEKIVDLAIGPVGKYLYDKFLAICNFCSEVGKMIYNGIKLVKESLVKSETIEKELTKEYKLKNKNKNLQKPKLKML